MNKKVIWSICRYLLSILAVILIGVGFFLWWAIGSNLPKHSHLPLAKVDAPSVEAPEHLVVASYNIGHGQGVKEAAWDYRDKATTEHQLSLVAEAMVKINADIYLLQEVDLDSNRTFHINQLEFIKERTKHPYHACALVWEKNYLPFPYWPPAHHLGYIRSANCVLSRFPLSNHERIIFDKPSKNPFWYNWGYIDRGLQKVDVKMGDQVLAVVNLHLEAWDQQAREEQIKKTIDFVNSLTHPIILGGDFNTVMPDAPKKHSFADDINANYEGEETMQWLLSKTHGIKTPQLDAPLDNPLLNYTFPSDHPDRRLDHIFLVGPKLSFINFRVGDEAGIASDHLPVIAIIKY